MSVLIHANSFSFINETFYIYNFNPKSSSHKSDNVIFNLQQISSAQIYLLQYKNQFKNNLSIIDVEFINYLLECSFVEIYYHSGFRKCHRMKPIIYILKYFLLVNRNIKKEIFSIIYQKVVKKLTKIKNIILSKIYKNRFNL